MEKELIEAAKTGDVHKLRNLIGDDPFLLRAVGLFGGDTLLHIACMSGNPNIVKEVLNLMPDLAVETNNDGFTPLHIASARGDIDIVKELLKVDRHLCLMKGKEMRIPLHYAVIKGRTKVVRELLLACSDSIVNVTVRGETCFHLAVKNSQFKTLKVLAEFVIVNKKQDVLNVKDGQGNNILHLAASKKQYEVVDLLLDKDLDFNLLSEVNSLNKRGLTPLDMLVSQGGDSEIEEILRTSGAKGVEQIRSPQNSIVALTNPSNNNQTEQVQRSCTRSRPTSKQLKDFFKYNKLKDSPSTVRNTLLVLAVLIATATYQAVLSPPGGVWQDDNWQNSNTTNNGSLAKQPPYHTAGQSVMGTHNSISFGLFLLFNSIGFFMSIHMMYFLTHNMPLQFELRVSLMALTATYDTCMVSISSGGKLSIFFIILSIVMPLIMPIVTIGVRDFRRRRPEVPSTVASV